MNYILVIHPKCLKEINKAYRKNPILKEVIQKKINEILLNPFHYKSLKYDFVGEQRVHILKSFVLKFRVNENRKTIIFLAFRHHDEAYKR